MPSNFQRTSYRNQVRKKNILPSAKIIILFLGIVATLFYFFIKSVGSIEIIPKKYIIDKGMTASVLDEKFTWNVASWRYGLWLKFFPPKNLSLQVWEYEAKRWTTIETFFSETLESANHTDMTITILPGWNLYDIDAYLTQKNIASVWDFLRTATDRFSEYASEYSFLEGRESLEWFLYPDTYRLRKDATPHDVILVLLSEFDKKMGESYKKLGEGAYRKLILASIVEMEERDDTNQPVVAGILEKRVSEGIAMWADATVCTGYAKTQKQCTPAFIASVIQGSNPYNTRKKQWYPPTPISSVPLSAWNAAINPKTSPYYYYLHGSDGKIHFATTLADHNNNKTQYIQ